MTADDVQSWLNRYVVAWQSYDPDAIADLFSPDATYGYNPWDDPIRGRSAIVTSWRDDPDEPGSWEASYRPFMVEGRRALATGETRYRDGKVYANMFELTFDDEGRCRTFVEWYMKHPG
jgi:hypothetical protein